MQRLLIFQSLWAMERRHTDGFERSLDENIAMISEAGFDGISAHYTNRRDVIRLNDAIRGTGLKIEGSVSLAVSRIYICRWNLQRRFRSATSTCNPISARALSRPACRLSMAGCGSPKMQAFPYSSKRIATE